MLIFKHSLGAWAFIVAAQDKPWCHVSRKLSEVVLLKKETKIMSLSQQTSLQDMVYIEDLKINAKIGVYEWERKIEQVLFVSLDISADLAKAGQSDDLADTLNYAALAEMVQGLGVERHYQLIEHFAEILAARVLEAPLVNSVTVKIHKPAAIPLAARVGIQITRGR